MNSLWINTCTLAMAGATVIEEMLPLLPEGMGHQVFDFGLHCDQAWRNFQSAAVLTPGRGFHLSFEVDFEPVGRRIACNNNDTLLEAAQRAGVVLNATCGGEGICTRCVVRVMDGQVSKPNSTEEYELGEDKTAVGWRLACQTEVRGDVRVHIPPDSLATAQRVQIEGQSLPIDLQPAVHSIEVKLPLPILDDLRSDAVRLRDSLGIADLTIPLSVLHTLSNDLRAHNFHVTVFLRGSTVVGVRPPGATALGLAVDLGTTKLAAYLVDLSNGETLASAGAMNPQIAFGEDVMTRIGHAISASDGGEQLRSVIVEALRDLADELCRQTNRPVIDIAEVVVVGNTAMHHLFLGLPVRQLGVSPYVPAEGDSLDIPARELGFEFAPAANVYLLPNIAGFVGADHVAMLLGSGLLDYEGIVLGMDIGTNTEISLIVGGKHFACSTASGPAFEGAHIVHGMRAAPGAIEKVHISGEQIMLQTIDNQPPVGLCGSGILDLVAQLRKEGILNPRGVLAANNGSSRIRKGDHGAEFVLLSASENNGREITFSRSDVGEIQLAKGAMRAGVNILLQKAGLEESDIDTIVIAGAFGTYLDVQSGIEIGMFPCLEKERFVQVGNAAGSGARMALLSIPKREQAVRISKNVTYIELTVEPSFSTIFTKCLFLE